jgi:hypothetical protein
VPSLGTIAAWALGIICIGLGGITKPDEERKIKNLLYEVWCSVTTASERSTAAIVAATGLALRTLERVMAWLYGPRTLSVRGVWTGLMISLAAFPMLAALSFVLGAKQGFPSLAHQYGATIVLLVVLILLILVLFMVWGLLVAASLPVRFKRFTFTVPGVTDLGWGLVVTTLVIASYLRLLHGVISSGGFVHPWKGLGLMLIFGAAEKLASMWILRWAGRRWEDGSRQSGWRRLVAAAVVLLAGWGALVILVRAPAWIAGPQHGRDFGWQALVLSILTNALEVLFVLVLLAVVGLFLVHALLWEALLRVAEKFQVEIPKAFLVGLGLLLITGRPIVSGIKTLVGLSTSDAVQAVSPRDASVH